MTDQLRFRFSIDRGGTFTDIYCEVVKWNAQQEVIDKWEKVLKLLSEDPSNYKDAPTEGIRRILEAETGYPHPKNELVDTSRIDFIRMGTTVATNALLERTGERIALIATKGFIDLAVIGNQTRPRIFDLVIKRPELLYECVVEVDERVLLLNKHSIGSYASEDVVIGSSLEKLVVERSIDESEVRLKLNQIRDMGIDSIAVVLMHSYTFDKHEKTVRRIAQELGFTQISLSSEVMPMIRIVPRGYTTCVDAYLTPVIKRYLQSFCSGFDSQLSRVNISFMQSDGGLTPMDGFLGNKAILSGPAGGVVGYAMTSYDAAENVAVIGFDMGGTSTDVSRFAGAYEHVFESTTAGITIQSPQLDINTVAAGGGSRLFFRNGIFVVGPESAGAHPGPVCYRKGGPLTITDANVLLGRIQPHLFPAIFGVNEDEHLDFEGTHRAFERLTSEINSFYRLKAAQENGSDLKPVVPIPQFTVDEVAYGFIRIGNEAMTRPIRNLTTMKGYDITKHYLSCFGGAGPQHCCAIAKSLGMKKIFVNKYSGVLSAYGLSLADVVVERQESYQSSPIHVDFHLVLDILIRLRDRSIEELKSQGFHKSAIEVIPYLNLRYFGTDTSSMTTIGTQFWERSNHRMIGCPTDLNEFAELYKTEFVVGYRREYGFELHDRAILVDDIRVRAIGNTHSQSNFLSKRAAAVEMSEINSVSPDEYTSVYFDHGRVKCPVFFAKSLRPGTNITGPAVVVQNVATVVIEPGCYAQITAQNDIEIFVADYTHIEVDTRLDPIYLSVFSHRFMGIAEQMGRTLQRTSISVNIKERLDFSCAIFDSNGNLVANAPHLPVHLGAMSEAVKYQIKYWTMQFNSTEGLIPGDVLVSNHPQLAGGSHLPDITVMTPVFGKEQRSIVFWVACRGHHADVGGISPGSMPPLSKTLAEEGAAIIAFKLVHRDVFQEAGITALLQAPGKLDHNSPARTLSDNISDLKAQVAANTKGENLMQELASEYSLEVVTAYMHHIQLAAETAVRDMLRTFSLREHLPVIGTVQASDFLDDGTKIQLTIKINRTEGSAVFDFEGTGHEIYGNLNAPPAVTASAIIYCLRCLLPDMDIPLNQGCLAPISIRIPQNCILNPSPEAAVVGGNVLTSQRVTDVVLRAFKACAASQGCMNNLTFGDTSMGYYETIAGGAGAGPYWNGCDGVHTHMTNTRITDPEILERRYPVILRQFGLRPNSGGRGRFNGGNGVIRKIEFSKELVVSILSERRAFQPYGMSGGEPGERGLNVLTIARDSRQISLGGKNTVRVSKSDVLTILTPGGGGYGAVEESDVNEAKDNIRYRKEMNRFPREVMTSGSLNQYSLDQESV